MPKSIIPGGTLKDKRIIAAEIFILWLFPLLWGLLLLPRTVLPFLLLGWLSLRLRRLGWREVGLRHPRNWLRTILVGIATGGSLAIISNLILRPLLYARLVQPDAIDPRDFSFLQRNLPVFLVVLAFNWLLAAIAEEMVFRGYVLNRLVDFFGCSIVGWGCSIMLSSLMFSVSHGVYTPGFILFSTLSGLLYSILYLVSQ